MNLGLGRSPVSSNEDSRWKIGYQPSAVSFQPEFQKS